MVLPSHVVLDDTEGFVSEVVQPFRCGDAPLLYVKIFGCSPRSYASCGHAGEPEMSTVPYVDMDFRFLTVASFNFRAIGI